MERNSLAIPIAIVVAAALIAGAIYLNGRTTPSTGQASQEENLDDIVVRPVDETDHIRGNPNAPILLVEYSDYDCPFCSQFHTTMKRIMDKYGTEGDVAWVYRHFPLVQLHPNAPKIAAASECAAELGGSDAFWTFTDLVFSEKPIETRNGQNFIGATDISRLPEFAERAGVERAAFTTCLDSGKYADKITQDTDEAIAAGGTGTPYTVIIAGNEVLGTIPGAFPFDNFTGSNGTTQSGVDEIVGDLVEQARQLRTQ